MPAVRVGCTPAPQLPHPSNLQHVLMLDGELAAVAGLEVIITQDPLSRCLRLRLGLSFWLQILVTKEKGEG